MTSSHPEFNDKTEALEVAEAFPDSIRGKTALVTGVNPSGIGFTTAEALASQGPAHLIVAGRTLSKLQDTIDIIKAKYPNVDYRRLHLDLSSQKAVRSAASEVLSWSDIPSINTLINSAGIMMVPERTLNEDGIEMHFATNHVGHFLFTCLIMPKLVKAAQESSASPTRIVNVTSLSPTAARMRWSDMNFDKINNALPESEQPPYAMHRMWGELDTENRSYVPIEGYNQSKVANVLFSIATNHRLAARYGIQSFAVHPGVITTELGRSMTAQTAETIQGFVKSGRVVFKSLGAGSATSLVAALDPQLKENAKQEGSENFGVYMIDCQPSDQATPQAVSSEEAEKLWKRSEELVQEKFEW